MLKRTSLVFILILVFALLFPSSALAIPQRPHQFYGAVTVGVDPAPDGMLVEAKINGTTYGTSTTHGGTYGLNYDSVINLMLVAADDPDTSEIEGGVAGDTVQFYIGSVKAEEEYTFVVGGYTELNLTILLPPLVAEAGGPYSGTVGESIALSGSASGGTPPCSYAWDLDNDGVYDGATGANPSHSWGTAGTYTIGLQVTDSLSTTATDTATVTVTAAPSPPAGGGGGLPTYYTHTDLFGVGKNYRISRTGKIRKTVEATSEDGNLTMTIPEGTIALGKDGKRLGSLEVAVDESPPDPPEDSYIIELAYDFGPDGATFDPAITLTWSYDPDALPQDVAEEDLVIAYYDEEWVEIDCVVDTENKTITVEVSHFTTFAIIGAVAPVPPPEEVVPPEEEEEVVPPEEVVAPEAPPEEVVPPPEEVAPPEEVVPPEEEVAPLVKPPINWPLIGGIIGVVVAAGLLIFFVVRRRRAA